MKDSTYTYSCQVPVNKLDPSLTYLALHDFTKTVLNHILNRIKVPNWVIRRAEIIKHTGITYYTWRHIVGPELVKSGCLIIKKRNSLIVEQARAKAIQCAGESDGVTLKSLKTIPACHPVTHTDLPSNPQVIPRNDVSYAHINIYNNNYKQPSPLTGQFSSKFPKKASPTHLLSRIIHRIGSQNKTGDPNMHPKPPISEVMQVANTVGIQDTRTLKRLLYLYGKAKVLEKIEMLKSQLARGIVKCAPAWLTAALQRDFKDTPMNSCTSDTSRAYTHGFRPSVAPVAYAGPNEHETSQMLAQWEKERDNNTRSKGTEFETFKKRWSRRSNKHAVNSLSSLVVINHL